MNLTEATDELQHDTEITARPAEAVAVSGGSISQAYRVPSSRGPLFVKLNHAADVAMFEAEADGLEALRDAHSLAIPAVYSVGRVNETAYLFLEWLDLESKSTLAEIALGKGLARQHRISSDRFGWARDNVIGPTRQPNTPTENWIAFLRDQRLGFQLDLATKNGLPRAEREASVELLAGLDRFFEGDPPVPSLLHGDLWSGNWGATASVVPYVFDPAVYFGDREADLAMTRLFGGFSHEFYAAYLAEWPLPTGWQRRVDLYNLYHLLNHFNLFGGGYLPQISAALARLDS
ncbi:MAG: fructosamine kinase family protein [Gammaproteobacteria bacterium]